MNSFFKFSIVLCTLLMSGQMFAQQDYACQSALKRCQADADKIEKLLWSDDALDRVHASRCQEILSKVQDGDIIIQECDNPGTLKKIQKSLGNLKDKFKDWSSGTCSKSSLCREIDEAYEEWFD
ncbi:MAG: hypothetical protein RLP14_00865 [Owenweeksia sp.]